MARLAELLHPLAADHLHGVAQRDEVAARVELVGVVAHELADGGGGREAPVGVDVDLAHAVADAALDRVDRNAEGGLQGAAGGVDALDQVAGHRGGAVHHQVGVGQPAVDLLDQVHDQHVAGRRLGELVGAVARADRDGQRVDAGVGDELLGLVGIGEVDLARAVSVLDAAERADLALHRDAARVGVLDDLARHRHVVLVARGRLAVALQRAVHHHRGEAGVDRGLADVGIGPVVEVQAEGHVRPGLRPGQGHVAQEGVAGELARARRARDDHRRGGLVGRQQHGLELLEVVEVEGGEAVAAFGGGVQQRAHRHERHVSLQVRGGRSGSGSSGGSNAGPRSAGSPPSETSSTATGCIPAPACSAPRAATRRR